MVTVFPNILNMLMNSTMKLWFFSKLIEFKLISPNFLTILEQSTFSRWVFFLSMKNLAPSETYSSTLQLVREGRPCPDCEDLCRQRQPWPGWLAVLRTKGALPGITLFRCSARTNLRLPPHLFWSSPVCKQLLFQGHFQCSRLIVLSHHHRWLWPTEIIVQNTSAEPYSFHF